MQAKEKAAASFLGVFGKWMLFAVVTGLLGGVIGAAFHLCIEKATQLRTALPWLIWLLPAGGVLIAFLYRVTGMRGKGTDTVIRSAQSGEKTPLLLLPAIYLSTVMTHLLGGSAGREGAALQVGGSIGWNLGRLLKMNAKNERIAAMCGMSAVFSALFGTPLTAACFAMEVVCVGMFPYAALVPCSIAALTAVCVTSFFGLTPTAFALTAQPFAPLMLCRVAALSLLCAAVSIVFCVLSHRAEHLMARFMPNDLLRAAIGGAAVLALTLLVGTRDYNGAGMDIVARAIEQGQAHPEAFALKLLFTVITLSCGFKGGEIVPLFFIGATLSCVVGPLLGIPAGFAAAIGLVAVFCGAVNCPLASLLLSIELFGSGSAAYFALACAVSYMLSGYFGLYGSQHFHFSKLSTDEMDRPAH